MREMTDCFHDRYSREVRVIGFHEVDKRLRGLLLRVKRLDLDPRIAKFYAPRVSGNLSGIGFREEFDLERCRTALRKMSDAELISFGRQMRALVYPLTYGPDRKPSVSAFSIQLEEARAEWRRRNPKKEV
jgi:hypothetical protein